MPKNSKSIYKENNEPNKKWIPANWKCGKEQHQANTSCLVRKQIANDRRRHRGVGRFAYADQRAGDQKNAKLLKTTEIKNSDFQWVFEPSWLRTRARSKSTALTRRKWWPSDCTDPQSNQKAAPWACRKSQKPSKIYYNMVKNNNRIIIRIQKPFSTWCLSIFHISLNFNFRIYCYYHG